jgi:hypothetical protein
MSEIKVNKISPRTNCGTVQLGDSGDTITIPAGATITNNGTAAGFGATGAASWDTTVKTSGFTAVSGVGYFVNTTSGAITVTLPASPDAGAVVAVKDYANTFDTNNVTLARNGSNIGGVAVDAILSTEGLAVTLVYVDATKGWLVTDNGTQDTAPTPQYVTATGGTITCCGDYKIHTFTGPGTFCVSAAGNSAGSNTVDYLVVAGGGSGPTTCGGDGISGGGGGGGFRFYATPSSNPQSGPGAPLNGPAAISVSATGYPITVGGGGAISGVGNNGSNSVALGITSTGGGRGGRGDPSPTGQTGGSGGGGNNNSSAGAGNTPPTSPAQGTSGGAGGASNSGGGGGAIVSGGAGQPTPGSKAAGNGGAGAGVTGFGTSGESSGGQYYFSGGGGGGNGNAHPGVPGGSGGLGGGGNGIAPPVGAGPAGAGTANTGGGGGGASDHIPGGAFGGTGGSGIVIIRYKFQN